MGTGAEVVHETVDYLVAHGEKVGMIKVRLYRPFSVEAFAKAMPATVKAIAVMDRTKEPGGVGEPLYTDVQTAFNEMRERKIAPFKTMPLMSAAATDSARRSSIRRWQRQCSIISRKTPKNHFTVGINDDVTHTSLDVDLKFDIEGDEISAGCFTVSARTVRSAPTRTRSRSSVRTRTTRRRDISCTTPRRPAPLRCRTCGSAKT